jgi:hypothetical protein
MTVSAFAENRYFSENVKQFSLDMAFSAFAEIGLSTEMTRQSIDFKQYFLPHFKPQCHPTPARGGATFLVDNPRLHRSRLVFTAAIGRLH